MNNRWIAPIVLLAIAAALVGWNVSQAKQAEGRDAESLKAQRAAATQGSPNGRGPGMGGPMGGPMGGGGAPDFAKELGLNADQQARMKQLQDSMKPKKGDKPEDMMKRMETMRTEMDKILTPEQKKKLEEMMPPMPSGGAGGPMAGPMGGAR